MPIITNEFNTSTIPPTPQEPVAPGAKIDMMAEGPSLQEVILALIQEQEAVKQFCFQTKQRSIEQAEHLNHLNLEVQQLKLDLQKSQQSLAYMSTKLNVPLLFQETGTAEPKSPKDGN